MSRWVLGFLAISLVATAFLTGPVRRLSYDDRCLDMGGGTQGARCFFGDLRASAPIGWRYLHAPDARVALGVPNARDADFQRLYQEADFNGDGRLDEAAVLIDDSGRSYRLFAFLEGSPPEPLTPPLGGEGFAGVMLGSASHDARADQQLSKLILTTSAGQETFVWGRGVGAWQALP